MEDSVEKLQEIYGEWIHYSHQLPPLAEDVLFCCEDENGDFQYVRVGWYEGQKTLGEAIAMETLDAEPNAWYPCTYWMPLPKPPTISSAKRATP